MLGVLPNKYSKIRALRTENVAATGYTRLDEGGRQCRKGEAIVPGAHRAKVFTQQDATQVAPVQP